MKPRLLEALGHHKNPPTAHSFVSIYLDLVLTILQENGGNKELDDPESIRSDLEMPCEYFVQDVIACDTRLPPLGPETCNQNASVRLLDDRFVVHKQSESRLLTEHSFPSPACKEKTFRSRSTCLIDLGSTLIVLTEGSEGGTGPVHTKGLFRLEVDRDAVVFADDEAQKKSKEVCNGILDQALAPYEECQIHKVSFPIFGQDESTVVKTRPCLCLYSNDPNVPSIYFALFAGAPRAAPATGPWEMILAGGDEGELVPAESPTHLLDLSKMCTLPELHMLDENEFLNGEPTYDYWKITKHKIVQVKKPSDLRRQVVHQLQAILLQNPFFEYKDNTRELDVGTWVVCYEVLRGEDVMRHMIYK